jgi:Dolichyl-phosphate-mannose-protein mannosyltransferase
VTLVAVFYLCFLWIVFIRLHTASEPLERDVSTQILMGRVLADGGKMYVDTIEFKPPGMFVIWQVIHKLVGTSPRVVVWVNIVVTTLTMLGVYVAASLKPWGRVSGLWAAVFLALISGDMLLQANQPSNEVFMNLFMVWGIAMWLRADSAQKSQWYFAAAGLLLGLVTLIKPALLTVILMVLAWLLAEGINPAALKRRAWAMIWVLLPMAALWSLMILYFIWQGRGTELYNCLVRYGVFYASNGKQTIPNAHSSIWMNLLRGLGTELVPTYLDFLTPLMLLTIFGIANGLRGRQRPQALTLAGCLLGTFFAVSIPGKFYPHYYQLYLPVLAVGAGWGVVTVAGALQRRIVGPMIGVLTLVILLCHLIPDCVKSGKTWSRLKYGEYFIEFERCGHAVNQLLKPDECFYVWGVDPSVYYYSDRRPASGIFWADRLLYGPSKTWATQKVIADLEKTQPPLILMEEDEQLISSLDHPPLEHPVYQWISARYVESPETKFSKYFNVYLRRGSALAFRISTNQQPFVLTLKDPDPSLLRQTSGELLQQGRTNEAEAHLQKAE